jgi:hypothetical protein
VIRRIGLTSLIAALILLFFAPVAAFAYGPTNLTTLGLDSSLVQPCSTLIVSGAYFQPGETVTVGFSGTDLDQKAVVGSNGSFSFRFEVPSQVQPGFHTVVATGSTGDTAATGADVNSGGCARLLLAPAVLKPGGSTVASGDGCPPGSTVTVTVGHEPVASTTADDEGAFSTPISPGKSLTGQQPVDATCGPTQLSTTLSFVVTSTLTAPEAGAATFGVFVLLGFVLLRGQFLTLRRRRKRPVIDDLEP